MWQIPELADCICASGWLVTGVATALAIRKRRAAIAGMTSQETPNSSFGNQLWQMSLFAADRMEAYDCSLAAEVETVAAESPLEPMLLEPMLLEPMPASASSLEHA